MDFDLKIDEINRRISPEADFPQIRESLQEVFNRILFSECESREKKLKAAFSLLSKVDNLDFPERTCEYKINISLLAETLVFCCDAVLCEDGRRVIFLSGSDDIYIKADPKIVTRAILNAVSNAVGYSDGDCAAVILEKVGESAVLTFQSSGDFAVSNYLRSLGGTGGLSFISKVVRHYGGCMLMRSDGGRTSFVFSLPAYNAHGLPEYEVPQADELLFDRLGAIYEALYRLTFNGI